MTVDQDLWRYSVRLLIRHPTIDPEAISSALSLAPSRSWRVGTPRMGPKGDPLPGVYRDTVWSWRTKREDREFVASLREMLIVLEPQSEFLDMLILSGGRVSLVLDLSGLHNTGDVLKADDLQRLARLNIEFSIEVFP
ncbi:hypothetical protein ABAC460_05580 [Asticcacaulis sp. AC460]|uniref:DUF4279 domain-containing protein n=1 Tax=Asticcacaulis sp. AC460 TaxID=1282360 RepID=UPI0003C3D334|nr:DUF4279 domain-containing protein [Asticcacaulis sp. AC460]ESQ91809.1 hypothetical protein ABAC460_05580 [Asticcacaulis sp. AC460]